MRDFALKRAKTERGMPRLNPKLQTMAVALKQDKNLAQLYTARYQEFRPSVKIISNLCRKLPKAALVVGDEKEHALADHLQAHDLRVNANIGCEYGRHS